MYKTDELRKRHGFCDQMECTKQKETMRCEKECSMDKDKISCEMPSDARYKSDSLYRYGSCEKENTGRMAKKSKRIMAHIVTDHETLEDILNAFGMTLEELLYYNRTKEIHLCPGKAILVKR